MRNLITGIMMCGLTACAAQTRSYESLSVEEFEKTLTESSVACLDVRTADEYADGHIANAFNADVREADFEKKVTAALPKSQTVALYCRSGNRSKKAAEILATKGYKVVELNSGISGWTNAGKAVTKEEVDRFTTPSGTEVLMYCIKHGSLRMRVGDKWIYVDPVTKAVAPETDYSTMPKADYILITHEHQDHLDAEAIRQLTKEGTVLITNPRCKELLGGKGDAMKNGDSRKLQSGWKLEAVPAYNKSADKQQFHPKGRDNGYILTIEKLRIYIAGDTEDIDEMKSIKHIDVAFLPCNLPFTMTPEQVAKAAKTIQPKVLFPYHYGKTDIKQVEQLLEGSGVEVRIRQHQ